MTHSSNISIRLNEFNSQGVALYAGINDQTLNKQANNFVRDKIIAENRKRLKAGEKLPKLGVTQCKGAAL